MENQIEVCEPFYLSAVMIRYALVRVVHAASNYLPIQVVIGNRRLLSNLSFGKVCPYDRITSGIRTVTIYSAVAPRCLLLETDIALLPGERVTLVLSHTPNGLLLVQIKDKEQKQIENLRESGKQAFFRVANFTYDIDSFDVSVIDKELFLKIKNKNISNIAAIVPGSYDFVVVKSALDITSFENNQSRQMILEHFYQKVRPNTMYTVYVIGGYYQAIPIQLLVVEN